MFKGLFIDGLLCRNGAIGFIVPFIFLVFFSAIGLYIADNVGVESVYGTGKIVSSEFIPEHTTTSTTTTNGVTTVDVTHHPDAWYMVIKVGGGAGTLEVSQDDFDEFKPGRDIGVKYIHGRITGGVYIRSLETQ